MTGHYRINLQVRLERRRENAFKSFEKRNVCRVPFLLFVQKMQSLGNATVSERGYGFTVKEGQSGCV